MSASAPAAPRRGMTVCEKILYHHALGLDVSHPPFVSTGEVLCVSPSWILSSEAAWFGMDKTYTALNRPSFAKKDRFWLANDHVVDPRINHLPKQQQLIQRCERIAREMDLGENYKRENYTIMHTEYYRTRVLLGDLVLGADSHTGSAGCLGALAIGMGITDVLIQLVTGETYIAVPEVVRINLFGRPPRGIGGKDVILGILGELKRNTVAAERLVEYTGPGLKYLSSDARFAIANMTTEFGGIGACVVPDAMTADFISRRKNPKYRNGGIYFRPDEDAQYAASYDTNLSKMQTLVALFPSPDNVKPISQVDLQLDGCFIGACTTSEEDIILAGLVVQECLKQGMKPIPRGLRRVTPGSVPITTRLRELGILDAFVEAGFVVGAPGCSYCVGMGADQAGVGEVWLSSQNRNFRDRMGKGSIANITSAAAVAVSSFDMRVRDPQPFLDLIDWDKYDEMRSQGNPPDIELTYSEPSPIKLPSTLALETNGEITPTVTMITGKVQKFGDNVDTDMIIPADKCMQMDGHRVSGKGAFCYYRPDFYEKACSGSTILVAGKSFGTGSSREQAPLVLQAAGIKCIIAKSYAFIYARNQANNGLLGIRLQDEEFYELAGEGTEVMVNLEGRCVTCGGREFGIVLDGIEMALLREGGLVKVYEKFGRGLFRRLQSVAMREGKGEFNGTIRDHFTPQEQLIAQDW